MAFDWSGQMARSYEFYEVDPASWQDVRRLSDVKSASLTFDRGKDTFGNAEFTVTGGSGERYIRAYMVAEQGGERRREPMGTFLAQASSISYDGRSTTVPMEAYTPLMELDEDMPPVGYYVREGRDSMMAASDIVVSHCRAPSSFPESGTVLASPHAAELDETWLGVASSLAAKSGHYLSVDPMGRIVAVPDREPGAMAPSQVFGEDNSTVIRDVTDDRDLYKVPNVYEAVLTTSDGAVHRAVARNDSPSSPTSTASRGRVILERDSSPEIADGLGSDATDALLQRYARRRLAERAASEHSVTFSHAWMPHVRVGDCVYLDFPSIGVRSRAVVEAQTIECSTGGRVSTTARFSEVTA